MTNEEKEKIFEEFCERSDIVAKLYNCKSPKELAKVIYLAGLDAKDTLEEKLTKLECDLEWHNENLWIAYAENQAHIYDLQGHGGTPTEAVDDLIAKLKRTNK